MPVLPSYPLLIFYFLVATKIWDMIVIKQGLQRATITFILDFVRFDIYDWIPIFAVLFVTALVLNTIFPNRYFSNTSSSNSNKSAMSMTMTTMKMPTKIMVIFQPLPHWAATYLVWTERGPEVIFSSDFLGATSNTTLRIMSVKAGWAPPKSVTPFSLKILFLKRGGGYPPNP